MAGIVPPFCFEFRMRKMVLGEREYSSGKSALRVLSEKIRAEKGDHQENQKKGTGYFFC
jgi:hypothetical protein